MAGHQIRDTTTTFVISGDDIQTSINERMIRHRSETDRCLTTVADMLKEKGQDNSEQVAIQAAAIMAVLFGADNLASDALVVQVNIERASFLNKECLELACIAKNLQATASYYVTLEEAKRYGLV